ncbi:MAG TPA: TIGR03808 family TAT-translocated repetitive protein [Xanthobacteraceae bacterium]|nr:TIGR03808 family TAT-translocated repetitive protein [Xanthobacteraceae bacterium]
MSLDRRAFFRLSALTTAVPAVTLATPSRAAPMSMLGVDAVQLGVRAGGTVEQTAALQNAIDQTAGARVPLVLGPGEYRTGQLKLPTGTQIVGVRGATRLIFEGGASLVSAHGADHVTLAGLIFEGKNKALPEDRGLLHLSWGGGIRIIDCEVLNSGGHGIVLDSVEGMVSGSIIANAAHTAIVSHNARGIVFSNNQVRACRGGISILRKNKGDDGSQVVDNRIEDIAAEPGNASGNGILIAQAANVTVRGNRMRRIAVSGIKGQGAANLQIVGNFIAEVGDAAVHAEADFDGVVVANNTLSDAAAGIAIVGFEHGGRLAVIEGNLIRNLKTARRAGHGNGAGAGIGISVEADATVSGNVIENAPDTGIKLGWGQYLRDVSVTGNVVRNVGYGITASISTGAGQAVIAANMVAEAKRGAIVGMDFAEAIPDDLQKNPTRYAHLTVRGNKVR